MWFYFLEILLVSFGEKSDCRAMADVIYGNNNAGKMKIRNLILWSFIFQWCCDLKRKKIKPSGVTVAILHNMTWGTEAAQLLSLPFPLSKLSRHSSGPDLLVYSHTGKKEMHSTVECQSWACHTRTPQPPLDKYSCRYLVRSCAS